jgi:5'-methylthioadenosine phosphorylase
MPIGIIAGTGFEHLFSSDDRRRMTTPFGRFDYLLSGLGTHELVVIPRHGFRHEFSPFRLPTKAHMFGFRSLGVQRVLATSSVASANDAISPGDLVIPDQFIDLTKTRDTTFYHFDVTVHTDMTEPFCESLRSRVLAALQEQGGVTVQDHGVDPAAPAQPRRRPSGQQRLAPDRGHPHACRPAHQGLRRSTHRRRPFQAGDHALFHWPSISRCDPEPWVMAPR